MGKKGPPYQPPDDAQWIVVSSPPHITEKSGKIDYSPLEYWLRALFDDQRAATFIYEISPPPDLAVIVELPSPTDLPIPKGFYGRHDLRLGLKKRPWFVHATGKTDILPYNFQYLGHPESTRRLSPRQSGLCEEEWDKFNLTIPYPIPKGFDLSNIPQRARNYCLPLPRVTPPPPDAMEIDHYPTPPPQNRQRTQNFQQNPQPEEDKPLFIPEEEDSKPKIKNLDPYQEEESISPFLRSSSSATIGSSGSSVKPEPRLVSVNERPTRFNASENNRESNPLSSRGDSRLTPGSDELKLEFADQDDTESRRIHQLLQTVNRSQSPSEGDRLSVKQELENQDGVSAQKMYQLLDAVNRGQSTHGRGPSIGTIKPMERKEHGLSRNAGSGFQPPARNRDQDRDSSRDGYPSTSSYSNPNSWRDRNERGGRERERERERAWGEDSERGRESFGGGGGGGGGDGDRKRPFGHPDNRDDRGSGDRQQYPDKRSRANYR